MSRGLRIIFLLAAIAGVAAPSAGATVLPTTISTDTTLSPSGGVYTGTGVTIASGVTLTIEPGTVLKISGLLKVSGTLKAEGTAENKIVFTSIKDDTAGGDTNGDGGATSPKAGNWSGIEFPAGSGVPAASVIKNAKIRYAGASSRALVDVKGPSSKDPKLIDSYLEQGGGPGVNINSASPEIHGNTISGNSSGISFSVASKAHASVDIENNLVKNNSGTGISVSAPTGSTYIDTASLGGNVVEGNGGTAVVYTAFPNSGESAEFAGNPVPPNITTNVLKGNKENGIWVAGRIAQSTTWEDSGYPLVVFNNGLNIGKGSTLTLEAGSVVKDEKRSIYVNGSLISEGTAEEPVTFTSYKDDTVGGDTNGDGGATVPAPGDWGAIEYREAGGEDPETLEPIRPELEYIDFRYAETALDIKFLKDMRVAHSDFVYNEKAIDVAETAEGSPELGSLSCLPPYLSFVISDGNWYGRFGLPAPDTNISGAIGAVLPPEYEPLFGAAASVAELNFSLYGTDNTIPYSIYSCPALGIPPVPVTPVIVLNTPFAPLFPDPEVE